MRRSGVIFIRRKLDDPLYKYVLRQFVGFIVQKRFNLTWSIEAPARGPEKCCRLPVCSSTSPTPTSTGTATTSCCSRCPSVFDQLHETREYAAYAGGKTPRGS